MIATAIIAGVSAAASVAGGIAKTASARRQQRALQDQLDEQKAENQAWYDRRYNEDFLQRSENQAVLEQARKRLMQSSRAAAGTAAVMGSSNAVAAAQKEANNEAYTGLVANVASNASKERDAVEDRYLTTKKNLASQQANVTNAKYAANQAAIDTAVAGVQGAANTYLAAHTPSSANDDANDGSDGVGKTELTAKEKEKVSKSPIVDSVDSTINDIGSEYKKNNLRKLLFGSSQNDQFS